MRWEQLKLILFSKPYLRRQGVRADLSFRRFGKLALRGDFPSRQRTDLGVSPSVPVRRSGGLVLFAERTRSICLRRVERERAVGCLLPRHSRLRRVGRLLRINGFRRPGGPPHSTRLDAGRKRGGIPDSYGLVGSVGAASSRRFETERRDRCIADPRAGSFKRRSAALGGPARRTGSSSYGCVFVLVRMLDRNRVADH